MTLKTLEAYKVQENIKLDVAIAIRKLLDDARVAYKKAGGQEDWEELEDRIKEMVFEDD